MSEVRIGIIGAGQIGEYHIMKYADVPGAKVVAICNRTREKAERVAAQWNIPHVCSDYQALLQREDIDAVDVCLHNNLHAQVTMDALRAGKHVYCEKPLCADYQEGVQMLEAAKQYGRMLHIQLFDLYQPQMRAAKRLVDGGALGEIYHARAVGHSRRCRPYVDGYGTPQFVQKESAGGGALLDMGVYHISKMLYLMGQPEISRISGVISQKLDMNEERRALSGYDVEEMATGYVRFANGAVLDVFTAWAAEMGKMPPSMLFGSKGGIQISRDAFSYHTTLCDVELDCTCNLAETDFRWTNTLPHENAYTSSEAHWVAALKGEVPLLPTAQIALDTLLIQEGIYLSDHLGREVTAEEVKNNKKTVPPL